jgi:hypothetical protein
LSVQTGAIGNSFLTDFGVSAQKIAAGAVVKNLNGLTDSVTLQAGSNVSISPNGNTLTISSTSGGLQAPVNLSGTGEVMTVTKTSGTGFAFTARDQASTAVAELAFGGTGLHAKGAGAGVNAEGGSNGVQATGTATGILATSTDGIGAWGQSTSNTGVRGNSNGGYGVNGISVSNDAVRGTSTSGTGVFGQTSSGYGVYGIGSTAGVNGESGAGFGVRGTSTSNAGVKGTSTSSIGVYGQSSSGNGVQGVSTSNDSVLGVHGGVSHAGVAGSNMGGGNGVYGESNANGHGGAFSGGITSFNGTKNFVEPHPTDPTKQIRFTSLEGPESGTYFRGTARTVNGFATIKVPEAFRMVSSEDGLTVVATPVGKLAVMAVVRQSLDEIVVQSSQDVTFHYMVNGVRRAFPLHDAVEENFFYVPNSPADTRFRSNLPPEHRERLVKSGILNEDGTINMRTVKSLGWDKRQGWSEEQAQTR